MNEMIEFKIEGTDRYTLVTTNVEDIASYQFKCIKTGKVHPRCRNKVVIGGKSFLLKQAILENVPYFKELQEEAENEGLEIPGFNRYLFLRNKKAVYNKETKNLSYFYVYDGSCSSTSMLGNDGKYHGVTFNQINYMVEYHVEHDDNYKYISSTLFNTPYEMNPHKIARVTKSQFHTIENFRNHYIRSDAWYKDHNTVDHFFDMIARMKMVESESIKLQNAVLETYV